MVFAIVLAGGQKEGLSQDRDVPVSEALIPIGNKYMVEYIIEALLPSSYLEGIVIAGPVEQLKETFAHLPSVSLVKSGDTAIQSFKKAVQSIITLPDNILIVTADVPLLTTQAVDDFIGSCLKSEGDLFYPIVSKQENENKYPGIRRTYVNLKEGVFTGGNLIFLKSAIIERCIPVAEQLVRLRKSPLRLASYIGWGVLLRYLSGTLSIRDAEKEVSRMMAVKGVGVISTYPEIGIDVDKQSDLALVQKFLCG